MHHLDKLNTPRTTSEVPNCSLTHKSLGLNETGVTPVLASMQTPWSNGQCEGQVTRLKLLKRQMYGRACFDLLRCRVLLAS
jgi:transposase